LASEGESALTISAVNLREEKREPKKRNEKVTPRKGGGAGTKK